ncbi:hypothetical protein OpiT1DRAFT_05271 [Opitutaceae bacterium TAV1]|nr:hypothetical protein OpiT1DRAFT_05271 [Opitutaceae bacterium TAV1]
MFHVEPKQTFYVPGVLASFLESNRLNKAQLAKALGTAAANVTKMLNDEPPQRLSPSILSCIDNIPTITPAEKGRIICAHLHDELVRAGHNPQNYIIRHTDGVNLQELDLSPELDEYIGIIARAAKTDTNLGDILRGLSEMLVERAALEADARVTQYPDLIESEDLPMVAEEPTEKTVGQSELGRVERNLARSRKTSA